MNAAAEKTPRDLRPRLVVIGVGGAGCNAVNNMIASGLSGAEFVVANTDAQSLAVSAADYKIQLGANLTEGLGAGSKPEIGEAAAEEAIDDIRARLANAHMVFVAAGMGGGTGTGAAAVIARVAKELGVLTVGVVTRPFLFEGSRRARIADDGIEELKKYVDTLIVIPNQNLFRIANDRTTFAEAFILADQVLYSGVACIVDLIVKEGVINLDFADVRTVMSGMGTAMMGTGEAAGDRRAIVAAEEAISNPLLDDVSLKGARGLLLSITGGRQLKLYEVDEAASRVRQEVDPEANIIVGATFDDSLGDRVRVSIVASGMSRTAPAAKVAHPAAGHPIADMRVANPREAPTAEPVSRGVDDLSTRLSAAFGYGSGAAAVEPAEGGTGRTWQAPNEVTIEERLPQFGQAQARFGAASSPQSASRPATFTPAQPAEHRRGHRRLPDVSDFPPVGQREYHAKTGRREGTSGFGGDADPRANRRGSFFQRLTGLVRGEAADENDSYDREPRSISDTDGSRSRHHDSYNGDERDIDDDEIPSVLKRSWRSQR